MQPGQPTPRYPRAKCFKRDQMPLLVCIMQAGLRFAGTLGRRVEQRGEQIQRMNSSFRPRVIFLQMANNCIDSLFILLQSSSVLEMRSYKNDEVATCPSEPQQFFVLDRSPSYQASFAIQRRMCRQQQALSRKGSPRAVSRQARQRLACTRQARRRYA